MRVAVTISAITASIQWRGTAAQGICVDNMIPINDEDFGEPDWEAVIESAFPAWKEPEEGCPRLEALGGSLDENYQTFPEFEEGKWNPCYYTKAFAGLNPRMGGYPTPIDTHYPYEFAAPFFRQPGDGSTRHCNYDDIDIGACPKLGNTCGKDCAVISDDYGIGHIPPFVPLAAVKKEYQECVTDICSSWFHYETSGCNIKKSALDEMVYKHFGDGTTIKFPPPILIANETTGDNEPTSTYFRLEYGGEMPACKDDNCRGPHYCTKEVADAGVIWGDFCPYVSTGENSGKYRHPHIALAALELWIANKCMPEKCDSKWLDSPNGMNYAASDFTSTSITWAEMDNNDDPMAQPAVPYIWPNSGNGIFPGLELYEEKDSREAPGVYVNSVIKLNSSCPEQEMEDDPKKEDEVSRSKTLHHYVAFGATLFTATIELLTL